MLAQQSETLKSTADDGKAYPRGLEHASSSSSVPVTPATDIFPSTGPTTRPASTSVNPGDAASEEVLQLKLRLAEAQAKLSRLGDRNDSQGFKSETDPGQGQGLGQMPTSAHENIWVNEGSFSESGDSLANIPSNRGPSSVMFNGNLRAPIHGVGIPPPSSEGSNSSWFGSRNSFNQSFIDAGNPYNQVDGYRNNGRLTPDSDMFFRPPGGRRGNRFDGRYASPGPFNGPYGPGPFSQAVGQYDMMPSPGSGGASLLPGPQGIGMAVYQGYQPQAMGSGLSPHATEFTSTSTWKNEVSPDVTLPR